MVVVYTVVMAIQTLHTWVGYWKNLLLKELQNSYSCIQKCVAPIKTD